MEHKQTTSKAKIFSFCLLFAVLFSGSCKKEISNPPPANEGKSTNSPNPNNPYSLKHMRKTIAKLLVGEVQLMNANKLSHVKGKVMFSKSGENVGISPKMNMDQGLEIAEENIGASHYYIKFMPRDDADYSKLKADSNLVIYPFPLDDEEAEYPGNYRDPAVPEGVPTYQYAAVPVGYELPDVPYTKIEELFIPDTRNAENTITLFTGISSYEVSSIFVVNVAECAKNLGGESNSFDDCRVYSGGGGGVAPANPAGNEGDSSPWDYYSLQDGKNWRPHGRITVYDEVLQKTIGVEGLKVRARRWFTTYTGITDANGYYAVDGWFTRPANYWMDFERYEFAVIDATRGIGTVREIDGPKIEAAWNVNLEGYDKFCSTIFRAAYHYYYKDIQGLRRPPQNSFWKAQMKLRAYDYPDPGNPSSGGNILPIRRLFGIGEFIHIYNPVDNNTMKTFATTIHELAHAVHWEIDRKHYNNNDDATLKLAESWARGPQWALTKMVYPTYPGGSDYLPFYTNVVMDLIDPDFDYSNTGLKTNNDLVSGYSIVQIQDALDGAANGVEWKNNLKNNYENSTENNLDALFSAWGF